MPAKKKQSSSALAALIEKFNATASRFQSIILLLVRVAIATLFWKSGLTKIQDWETTLFLFEIEYQVPLLPVQAAAFLGTAMELLMPVLLVLGFASRIAAFSLILMTALIQYIYPTGWHDHYTWFLLLGTIATVGPGAYSLDDVLTNKVTQDSFIPKVILLVLAIIVLHEVAAIFVDITPWLDSFLMWIKDVVTAEPATISGANAGTS